MLVIYKQIMPLCPKHQYQYFLKYGYAQFETWEYKTRQVSLQAKLSASNPIIIFFNSSCFFTALHKNTEVCQI